MSLSSMTGFGVAERAWPDKRARVAVELRSVNARYLELKLRQPFGVAVEHRLRKRIEAALGRGRVDLSVRVEGAAVSEDALGSAGVDRDQLASTLAALASLATEAADAKLELGPPSSLELLRFLLSSGASGGGRAAEAPAPPAFIDELVGEALDALLGMRASEGQALAETLAALYAELEGQIAAVEASLVGEGERLRENLEQRAAALVERSELGAEIDPARISQEIALLLVRGDVSEELARIASHLDQARTILAAEASAGQGKTLDFLSQELLREVTTIGSKITSHGGSAVVIEAKRTIERIREQVQNVE